MKTKNKQFIFHIMFRMLSFLAVKRRDRPLFFMAAQMAMCGSTAGHVFSKCVWLYCTALQMAVV
jgi:hypothetical protein